MARSNLSLRPLVVHVFVLIGCAALGACAKGSKDGSAGATDPATDGSGGANTAQGASGATHPNGGAAPGGGGGNANAQVPGDANTRSADTPVAGGQAATCTTQGTQDVTVTVRAAAGPGAQATPIPRGPGLFCQNIYDPARSDYVNGATGDYLNYLKALKPGYLRWPTGYLSQKYQWSRNESAGNINDGGSYVITPNLLAAYLNLCKSVGAQPFITVNIDATPESLADLVKFANVENKYGITWWELGNEPDVGGYIAGQATPQIYAAKAVKIAAAMRAVDSTIKLTGGVMLSGENVRGVKPVDDSHAPISWARPIFDAFAANGAAAQLDGFSWHYYPMNASSNPSCGSSACYCWTGDNGCTSSGYLLQEDASDWPPAGLDYPQVINSVSTDGPSDNGSPFPGLRPMMNGYRQGMWMWVSEFAEDPSSVANGAGLSDKNIGMLWAADEMGRFAEAGTESICKFLYKTDSQSPQFKYTLVDENNQPRPSYYAYYLMAQHLGDQVAHADSSKIDQVAAHATVLKQDGSLRLTLVNKNAAALSVRLTLADFKPSAGALYQAVADSLYGSGVTLNGATLSSQAIAKGAQAVGPAALQACADNIVKLPAYSVSVLIFAK